MKKPTIALTMGDPAGIGPEVILRALADPSLHELCHLVVFGDAEILTRCANVIGLPMPEVTLLSEEQFASGTKSDSSAIIDLRRLTTEAFATGQVSAACGQASYDYIQAAISAALAEQVDAVTTAPINKEALRAAGIHYPGHTEMFAQRAHAQRWCMMQYSLEITCSFVTVHVGYAEVPALITAERVLDTIELTADALRKIRRREPHLVVCGLNPHAGENGLFGRREEEQHILPAIEEARRRGISVAGPLPPDSAFLPGRRQETDAFVCMYHDQGHIPVKALAFDSAVNTTLGLSVLRTSVDHGTAFDIAWQGKARPHSLFAAIQLAVQLAARGL